jgi:hypothetical protein
MPLRNACEHAMTAVALRDRSVAAEATFEVRE